MELVSPWVLYIGIPVIIILPFLRLKQKDQYQKGNKVANTGFIEETPYYKKLLKQYKILRMAALSFLLLAVAICFFMISRPAEIETVTPEIHNRDIFLCLDISDSVDQLNLEICDELKNVVEQLDGERFGITIFNGKSILLVPLTTDYEYVLDTLDDLKAAFEFSIAKESMDLTLEDYTSVLYNYKYEGTLCDYGSSFIGDGLASCLYNFPDLKENDERSRLIIFATDNDLNGTPIVTVDEAAALCAKNDVKVFAIAPDFIVDEDSFKKAMESTGGGYYRASTAHAFDNLIEDIEKTETSVMEEVKTIITDKPEGLFICLVVFMSIYFIFSRKVKL